MMSPRLPLRRAAQQVGRFARDANHGPGCTVRRVLGAVARAGLTSIPDGHARGGDLDAIGVERATIRNDGSSVTAIVRLSTARPLARSRLVLGVAVGNVTFRVPVSAAMAAGAAAIDLDVVAEVPGPTLQELAAGALRSLADRIPDVVSTLLLADPHGGALRETDDAYRRRGGARMGEDHSWGLSQRLYRGRAGLEHHRHRRLRRPPRARAYPRRAPEDDDGDPISPDATASLIQWRADDRLPQGDDIAVVPAASHPFAIDLAVVVDRPEAVGLAMTAVLLLLPASARTLGGRIVPSDLIAAAKSGPGVIECEGPGLAFATVRRTASGPALGEVPVVTGMG